MIDQKFLRKCSIIIFCTFILFSCTNKCIDNKQVEQLYNELKLRLQNADSEKFYFPPIVFDSLISANALLMNDTIRVGKSFFTNSFFTDEDRLSILFHELNHYKLYKQNAYPCLLAPSGKVFQVMTDDSFMKPASPIDTIIALKFLLKDVNNKEERAKLEYLTKRDEVCRFIYAPSNLSREEIACYSAEISAADSLKLFLLSDFYRLLINHQIKLEKLYLQMRIDYEKLNSLNSSGEKQ